MPAQSKVRKKMLILLVVFLVAAEALTDQQRYNLLLGRMSALDASPSSQNKAHMNIILQNTDFLYLQQQYGGAGKRFRMHNAIK